MIEKRYSTDKFRYNLPMSTLNKIRLVISDRRKEEQTATVPMCSIYTQGPQNAGKYNLWQN